MQDYWQHLEAENIQRVKMWAAKDNFMTAGRFGVHLVREISPWSSQVLCIGLVKT